MFSSISRRLHGPLMDSVMNIAPKKTWLLSDCLDFMQFLIQVVPAKKQISHNQMRTCQGRTMHGSSIKGWNSESLLFDA